MIGVLTQNQVTLIVAITAPLVAVSSLPLGHWLQGRRERRQWEADRRLDAYSSLAHASSELASATSILAEVLVTTGLGPAILGHAQNTWTAAHQAFGEAQYRAVLLAGRETVDHVVAMSGLAFDMNDAMQRARPIVDSDNWTIGAPGDRAAIEALDAMGARAVQMRDEFLRLSRREIGME